MQKKHLITFHDKNYQHIGYRKNVHYHNEGHICQTYNWHYTKQWKVESFPTRIRNKTSVLTCMTPSCSTGRPNQNKYAREINKMHPNQKRSKIVFVCSWHDLIHRKPWRVHQKPVRTKKTNSVKFQDTKSAYKSLLFVYTLMAYPLKKKENSHLQ